MIKKNIDKLGTVFSKFLLKGQIRPSSKFLVHKVTSKMDYHKDLNILQLGFGTGVFSKEIIKLMNDKSKLIIFEIRKECREYYNELNDSRVIYIEDSAENVSHHFKNIQFDYILSTLPMGNFSDLLNERIYGQICLHLKPQGKFLQYQYSLLSKRNIIKYFHKKPTIDFELLNMPPAFIYEVKNE